MTTKRATRKEIASSGGVARSKALTPKRKTEIAKAGAAARWTGKPGQPKGLRMPARTTGDGSVKVGLGHRHPAPVKREEGDQVFGVTPSRLVK